jgi:hypothetical protein
MRTVQSLLRIGSLLLLGVAVLTMPAGAQGPGGEDAVEDAK